MPHWFLHLLLYQQIMLCVVSYAACGTFTMIIAARHNHNSKRWKPKNKPSSANQDEFERMLGITFWLWPLVLLICFCVIFVSTIMGDFAALPCAIYQIYGPRG
ncbi:MAG: hypothetical protein KGI50_02470 [Patescibacteria group bacterium]|nr:hypothetical protein [Patescibacteria group bacterium]MDE2437790.1 hypothetical protein [Patescibacteria group bacterium]